MDIGLITGMAFVMGTSLVLFLYVSLGWRRSRLETRLDVLTDKEAPPSLAPVREMALRTLPRMGQALLPKTDEERTKLQARMMHAGYYSRQAIPIFFGVKLLLMVGPALLGGLLVVAGVIPRNYGLLGGACLGIAGMVGPSFWLDKRKSSRQTSFRRALPDALDVIVICLEGGLSLQGALRRVGSELRTAHPLLAQELNIVQREMHLGQSAGTALQHFADRGDLEELRHLATCLTVIVHFLVERRWLRRESGQGSSHPCRQFARQTVALRRGDGSEGLHQDPVPHGFLYFSGAVSGHSRSCGNTDFSYPWQP